MLLVQGTAFNWPWPDHVRIVTLPREDTASKWPSAASGDSCPVIISNAGFLPGGAALTRPTTPSDLHLPSPPRTMNVLSR